MASVVKRTWCSRAPTGHKVRRFAWGYTLQVNGKQERRFNVVWSREDAQEALAARILERDGPLKKSVAKTLGEMVDEYLAQKRALGKRSIRNDEMATAAFLVEFGRNRSLTEIQEAEIARYAERRLTETSQRLKRSVRPATVNRQLAILRGLLRLAKKRRYLTEVPEFDMAKEPEGRLRFLSEDEATRLLAACEEASSDRRMISQRSPYLFAIVTIALNTGMRKGEILGLAWECVDFARGVILLERTKSGRRREVPMNRAVDRVLADLREKQARASDDGVPRGPVFRRTDGSAWGNFRNAFEGACEAAKVFDFRFHDLRHTFGSWLVMRGRPLKEVQELLGHASITMTMRYAHLAPDRLRDAVASLEDFSTKSAQEAVKAALHPVTARQN